LLSQFLTLYTTPVIYLYLGKIGDLWRSRRTARDIEAPALRAAEYAARRPRRCRKAATPSYSFIALHRRWAVI
jgi:hypothetical protein